MERYDHEASGRGISLFAIVVGVLVVVAFLSNPDEGDFDRFVRGRLPLLINREIGLFSIIPGYKEAAETAAANIIEGATTRDDYWLFSVYRVDTHSLGQSQPVRVLGICGKFIVLQGGDWGSDTSVATQQEGPPASTGHPSSGGAANGEQKKPKMKFDPRKIAHLLPPTLPGDSKQNGSLTEISLSCTPKQGGPRVLDEPSLRKPDQMYDQAPGPVWSLFADRELMEDGGKFLRGRLYDSRGDLVIEKDFWVIADEWECGNAADEAPDK